MHEFDNVLGQGIVYGEVGLRWGCTFWEASWWTWEIDVLAHVAGKFP